MAGDADEGTEIAVQLYGWEFRVCCRMQGVYVLCDDASDEVHFAKALDRPVSGVGSRSRQIGPAEEAARPVSFPGFMVVYELGVEYRTVGLVERVGATDAAVISQARCYRYPCAGKQHGLVITATLSLTERRRKRSSEEGKHSGYCPWQGYGFVWYYSRGR